MLLFHAGQAGKLGVPAFTMSPRCWRPAPRHRPRRITPHPISSCCFAAMAVCPSPPHLWPRVQRPAYLLHHRQDIMGLHKIPTSTSHILECGLLPRPGCDSSCRPNTTPRYPAYPINLPGKPQFTAAATIARNAMSTLHIPGCVTFDICIQLFRRGKTDCMIFSTNLHFSLMKKWRCLFPALPFTASRSSSVCSFF